MEAKSRLLEHTLVLAGDVVAAGSSVQGWPAEIRGYNIKESSPENMAGSFDDILDENEDEDEEDCDDELG